MSPGCAPAMMPFSPRTTFSTSGVSGRLVKTTSTCAATSRGEFAAVAPSADNSSTADVRTIVDEERESRLEDIPHDGFAR